LEGFSQVLEYVNNVIYLTLGVAAFRLWRRQGGAAAAWVAATFGTLAALGITLLLTPEEGEGFLAELVLKLVLLGLIFFAYSLYRFTSALTRSSPLLDRVALGASVAVSIFTLFLGDLSEDPGQRSTIFELYLISLLVQWGGLLITVAIRLWGAGRGQPTLARRRMRLLSIGSLGLTLILLISTAETGDTRAAWELTTDLLATASVLCFFLGFAPPALVRVAWRRNEQEALRRATERLVSANTEREVTDTLLPHVSSLLSARAAILVSPDGQTIGSYGEVPNELDLTGETRTATSERVRGDVIRLDFDFGSLIIWASPYTPFFGDEEVELLRSLGLLTGLAMDRTQLYRREEEARNAAEDANRELQEANERLSESRAQLAEAQSIAHIGSFAWDIPNDIVEWSDEMYQIVGVDAATTPVVTYASYLERVHPDDREFVEKIIAKALEERRPYSFDHRIVRPDGSERILHSRGRLEVDESDQPVRLVGTAQDVTASREAERQIATALSNEREARRSLEDVNAEMENFVYTVSHDLNSPITAIQGFAGFLLTDFGELLPDKGRFYVERINASASYLQSLIKDLLSFSRVGRVQTEVEEIGLNDVVLEVADELKGNCESFDLVVGHLPTVRMNPLRARQLFTNLFQNSCRHAGRPDVRVTVAAEDVDGMVQVSIRDNGPGIPRQHRKRVFGVFERLQESAKTEGTGMGLPICKKIVETTGGSMWIEDSAEGLEIRFTLPAVANMSRDAAEARVP
jgi:PAS domain S-box-containing protein